MLTDLRSHLYFNHGGTNYTPASHAWRQWEAEDPEVIIEWPDLHLVFTILYVIIWVLFS